MTEDQLIEQPAELPEFDAQQALRFFELIRGTGGCVEARAIYPDGRAVVGFFTDGSKFVEAVRGLNGSANLYAGINPRPARFMETGPANKFGYGSGAKNEDVEQILIFPVDTDPVRPKDQPSNAAEHEAGMVKAFEVGAHLEQSGARLVFGSSGNGGHAFIKIVPIANNAANRDMIKRLGDELSAKFSDAAVHVDQSVYDLARIMRISGTLNIKGIPTPDRPHRMARPRGFTVLGPGGRSGEAGAGVAQADDRGDRFYAPNW